MGDTTTIQLPAGPIKARVLDDRLLHARGIPYATAKRFETPQPIGPWTEILDCTERAPICPQLPSRLESVMGPLTTGHALSEDCLRVSVTAPKNAKNAPVMVWLHGGAYISGGGDLDCYQGVGLADRGAICVNITYRLGVFGYLHMEGIAPANLGILDQRAALEWVQHNIAAFGGNSDNVTMVGQSAGADSIICLIVAEGTKGLFHRAILLSPPLRDLRERSQTADLLTKRAEQLFKEDPREMSTDDLLGVQKQLLINPVRTQVMLFAPALGYAPLPNVEDFDRKVAENAKDIPILIGWTAHDGRPFASMMGPPTLLKLPLVGPYVEAIGTWYITQSYFKWPSLQFHEQVLQAGGKSTSYSFEWAATGNALGACHCIDIPFILGTHEAWNAAPMLVGKDTANDISLVGTHLKDMWVAFAGGKEFNPGHIQVGKGFTMSPKIFSNS
ncbi:hypothetical protein N7462_005865 [Penicillium macrosclerotiorum]|uniref:uncharacterized protein n=1 Tax=Penicillium macrosclerotiorum TaxID=303699 RepID=UPI0025483FF2|nr:uncharacterized protein N7462_005865 [Penicillium macrosclerotiorum]KAJ5682700.1 hypothetical protein N7462_005865 [Penicillium macrosclerotiorum]